MSSTVQIWILFFAQVSAAIVAYRLALVRNRHVGGWVLAALAFSWIAVFLLAVSPYRHGEYSGEVVCLTCGAEGSPSIRRAGSPPMQMLLYSLFIVPGIVYAVRRKRSEVLVCAACESSRLADVDWETHAAREALWRESASRSGVEPTHFPRPLHQQPRI